MILNEIGKSVIQKQIDSLLSLQTLIDDSFTKAVEAILACNGRTIITGIGKSGLIGAKIASSLSSVGTPSFFVHPGEASHGDLGMITKDDIVIVISRSGESQELFDILHYCRSLSVPIISITGAPQSALALLSSVVLLIPNTDDAGISNAPMNTTTCSLVLGDALAVACARTKGFKDIDFQNLHPGGSLGKQFLLAEHVMRPPVSQVSASGSLDDVIETLNKFRYGLVAIIEDNLIGVITDGDIRKAFLTNKRRIEEIITYNPITVGPKTLVRDALSIMNTHQINCIPICENKTLLGFLHLHDCLKVGLS